MRESSHNQQPFIEHQLHKAPGQAESQDIPKTWLGVWASSLDCTCVCVCCIPPFANHVGPPHNSRSPSRNSHLGGRGEREEGKWGSSGPLPLPCPAPLLPRCLLSPFSIAWILGKGTGNLREEGKRRVVRSGFQPSQRQEGAVCVCILVKVTPASCWQPRDRMWSSRNFTSKGSPRDWSREFGFLFFPCCLGPSWARCTMLSIISFDTENHFKIGRQQGTFLIN